jgi:hypothetical protein
MNETTQDTTLLQAIVTQIKVKLEDKNIPVTWLQATLHKLLGIKAAKKKKRPLAKYELVKLLELQLNSFANEIHKLDTKKVKALIGGDCSLIVPYLTKVPTTVTVETENQDTPCVELLEQLTVEQAWKLLDMVTTYEEVTEKKEVKATTPKAKPNYISISKEEATVILGEYYKSLASEASITTPECFRGGRTSNPTQHLQRLLYSYHTQDCKQPNSITESVFTWHKGTDKKMTVEEAQRTIDTYIASHPEHLEEVNALASKACVKALVNK